MPFIASCYRSGEIIISPRCPLEALRLATGSKRSLENAVKATARLADDNKTWLVPGLPEAPDRAAALEAAARFENALKRRLKNQKDPAASNAADSSTPND